MTGLSLIVFLFEPSAVMPRALSRSYPAFAARRQGECALAAETRHGIREPTARDQAHGGNRPATHTAIASAQSNLQPCRRMQQRASVDHWRWTVRGRAETIRSN